LGKSRLGKKARQSEIRRPKSEIRPAATARQRGEKKPELRVRQVHGPNVCPRDKEAFQEPAQEHPKINIQQPEKSKLVMQPLSGLLNFAARSPRVATQDSGASQHWAE
jgi:hypothetical protein